MTSSGSSGINQHPGWGEKIPEKEWSVYRAVIQQARAQALPFAFGGAFATAVYTGTLRDTKDFDVYILPSDRESMQAAITRAGLQDYYERLPYDRSWIYRGNHDDIIVDAIWAMANYRAEVDPEWLSRGPEVIIRGERLRALPVEELLWCKLYIIQRERCDWGDVFNLLDARARSIDWDHLLGRVGSDALLLAGALTVFAWLAPDRADEVPPSVWSSLGLRKPALDDGEVTRSRAALLDSRPWFLRHTG